MRDLFVPGSSEECGSLDSLGLEHFWGIQKMDAQQVSRQILAGYCTSIFRRVDGIALLKRFSPLSGRISIELIRSGRWH